MRYTTKQVFDVHAKEVSAPAADAMMVDKLKAAMTAPQVTLEIGVDKVVYTVRTRTTYVVHTLHDGGRETFEIAT